MENKMKIDIEKMDKFSHQTEPKVDYQGVDIKCGNSRYTDEEWDYNGIDGPNALKEKKAVDKKRRYIIDFSPFKEKPELLKVVKSYMFSQLNENTFSTAKRNFDGLIQFIKFVNKEYSLIDSFSDIDEFVLQEYFNYLFNVKSESTGKKLSATSVKKGAFPVKEILLLGNTRGWNVPKDTSFVKRLYDTEILRNKRLKKQTKNAQEKIKNKVIDENLINDILQAAIKDLRNSKNIMAAAAIVMISQLGMRIEELLTIKRDGLKLMDNKLMIVYQTKKLENEPLSVSKPVNELVELAFSILLEYTEPLSIESGINYLFLSRNRSKKGHPVVIASKDNFNKNVIRPWLNKHKLRYKNGDPLDFTSHTFRHIFATYSFAGGATIEVISSLMNHKSIRGTEHYTHLLEENIKKRFKETMSSGSILAGNKASEIKQRLESDNPFKGKTLEEVDSLRKSMKIQELPHGICLHHPMRNEPCEGAGVCLGCNNFITTPRFLDIHKERLERVRANLKSLDDNGPFKSKMLHIEQNLVKLISELETQMESSENWLPKID